MPVQYISNQPFTGEELVSIARKLQSAPWRNLPVEDANRMLQSKHDFLDAIVCKIEAGALSGRAKQKQEREVTQRQPRAGEPPPKADGVANLPMHKLKAPPTTGWRKIGEGGSDTSNASSEGGSGSSDVSSSLSGGAGSLDCRSATGGAAGGGRARPH